MIKKLILFYPSSISDSKAKDIDYDTPGVPIGIMSLASFVEKQDIKVVIIDARLYDKKTSSKKLFDAVMASPEQVMVGFSATTSQTKHAYMLSKELKLKYPKIPVVWGGIHPTLYPEQTIKSDFVDFVIAGEGEYGLIELIKQLNKKADFSKVPNLIYKDKGRIFNNSLKNILDINELPPPAYHLLDIEKYLNRELYYYDLNQKVRAIDINTSRGCPYRCAFCTNTLHGFKRWRPLTAENVCKMIDYVVKQYNVNHIWFMDDFFFGDKERVKEILKHIIKKDHKITWKANARANLFTATYFTPDFLELMRKSGCIRLMMGIESGSEFVLKILKKDITLQNAIDTAKICKKYHILSELFFMGGIPGETKKDFYKTIDLMIKLKHINPHSIVQGPGLFRPYPGTELYLECKKKRFNEPKTLEEWTKIELSNNFGISDKNIKWTNFAAEVNNAEFTLFNYMYVYSRKTQKIKNNIIRLLLYYFAKIRIKFHFFKIPIEKKLFEFKKNWISKIE